MAFADLFRQLVPDMTPSEIKGLLGPPAEIDDTTIPAGSGWGLQESLRYKIRAGEPVLQWTYFDDAHDHVVMFAKPDTEWLVTLSLSLPRGLVSDRLDHNPYSPHSLECDIRVPAEGMPKFPLFIAGPVLGALLGIVHVGSVAMVWALHGFPDYFFRAAEWVFIGGFLVAAGGSLIGLFYASLLAFVFRTLRLQLNLRFHNWAAVVATLLITTIASEVGYHRGQLVWPLLTGVATIACAVVAAFISARPCTVPTANSKPQI